MASDFAPEELTNFAWAIREAIYAGELRAWLSGEGGREITVQADDVVDWLDVRGCRDAAILRPETV